MDAEALRSTVLAQHGAQSGFPFGPDVEVFKVKGKMFALMPLSDARVSLKCNPAQAIALRAKYPEVVLPGYHLSKAHWNTVVLDGTVPADELVWMVEHSYALVVAKLKKADRLALQGEGP